MNLLNPAVTVLIAGDHPVGRAGLRALVRGDACVKVEGSDEAKVKFTRTGFHRTTPVPFALRRESSAPHE